MPQIASMCHTKLFMFASVGFSIFFDLLIGMAMERNFDDADTYPIYK